MSQTRAQGQAAGLTQGLLRPRSQRQWSEPPSVSKLSPESRDKGGGTCYLTSSQVKQPARQRAREGQPHAPHAPRGACRAPAASLRPRRVGRGLLGKWLLGLSCQEAISSLRQASPSDSP